MEYIETSDGQIQADFARRVGQVLLHYEDGAARSSPEDSYEATLTICLLQALLTNCVELIKGRPRNDPTGLTEIANRPFADDPTKFGLDERCVVNQWPSRRKLMYREIFECLRNAMSHPLPVKADGLPTTGYTTWKSQSGVIEGFCFTQSPWVNSKGNDVTDALKVKDEDRPKLVEQMAKWSSNRGTDDLTVRIGSGERYRIYIRDQPFIPYLQLKISTTQLRTFTLTLSDYLAEPLVNVRAPSPKVRTFP